MGKLGQALSFNGSNQSIQSSNFNLGAINGVTLSAWVKNNSATGGGVGQGIVYKFSTVFEISLKSTGELISYITNGTAWHLAAISPAYVDWDTWHLITAAYDGSNVVIYRDGVQVAISGSETGSLPSSNAVARIGQGSASTNYWNGAIDEVRVYSRALNATEALELYNSGKVEIRK